MISSQWAEAFVSKVRTLADNSNFTVTPPPEERLQRVKAKLTVAAKQQDYSTISSRDWRHAAWLLWESKPYLIDEPGFFDAYTTAIRDSGRSALNRLIYNYILKFGPDVSRLVDVGRLIRERLSLAELDGLAVWRRRDQNYDMFMPTNAIRRISQTLITSNQSRAFEDELGLSGPLAQDGMIMSMWLGGLSLLEGRLRAGQLDGIQLQNITDSLTHNGALRFWNLRIPIANSLLAPFAQRANPAAEKLLKGFFLNHYGDPRIARGNWQGVSPDATKVMQKWLVDESLRLFFEIITRASEGDKYVIGHWRYRRAFWTAYANRGYIDEAWMALGPRVANLARSEITAGMGFGDLSQVDALHAALFMRVGSLILVEWSYNGKCRAWSINDAKAPRMGARSYSGDELKTNSLQIDDRYQDPGLSHIGSENGYWQDIMSGFIRGRTGLSVVRREYMP